VKAVQQLENEYAINIVRYQRINTQFIEMLHTINVIPEESRFIIKSEETKPVRETKKIPGDNTTLPVTAVRAPIAGVTQWKRQR
jgi:aspartate-semialdehyde dehydrogenase